MDSGKIIYEKQFPKLTMMDYSKMLEETEKTCHLSSGRILIHFSKIFLKMSSAL